MTAEKAIKDILDIVKDEVGIPTMDRGELVRVAKETLIQAFEEADFKTLLKECILEAMVDVEIKNPILTPVEVKDVRIVTETQESQEVKSAMAALAAQVHDLKREVESFNYASEVREAVKKGTEDVHLKNAVVTDVPVTNAIIKDEDFVVKHIVEKTEVVERPFPVKVPSIREEYIKVKKLVFPDGREAI